METTDVFCLVCLKTSKCVDFKSAVSASYAIEEFCSSVLGTDSQMPVLSENSGCCDTCLSIIKSVCDISFTIQRLEKELEWKLDSITEIMKLAGCIPSRMQDLKLTVAKRDENLNQLEVFRQGLLDNCITKGWKTQHGKDTMGSKEYLQVPNCVPDGAKMDSKYDQRKKRTVTLACDQETGNGAQEALDLKLPKSDSGLLPPKKRARVANESDDIESQQEENLEVCESSIIPYSDYNEAELDQLPVEFGLSDLTLVPKERHIDADSRINHFASDDGNYRYRCKLKREMPWILKPHIPKKITRNLDETLNLYAKSEYFSND